METFILITETLRRSGMKRFFILSILTSIILFSACQNDSQITGPQSAEFQKSKTAEPKWIGLPQAADLTLAKKLFTFKFIKADEGGELVIDYTYYSKEGKKIKTYSSLYFSPGALKRSSFVTMLIDDNTGVAEFLPHQTFNEPALLNQTFTGLNLNGFDPSQIQLYYLNEDGSYEVMECDQLIVDIESGTIQVVNGRIPHFSLYGYGI